MIKFQIRIDLSRPPPILDPPWTSIDNDSEKGFRKSRRQASFLAWIATTFSGIRRTKCVLKRVLHIRRQVVAVVTDAEKVADTYNQNVWLVRSRRESGSNTRPERFQIVETRIMGRFWFC
jgi:hypothetical protein